jgi:hypothetical protein
MKGFNVLHPMGRVRASGRTVRRENGRTPGRDDRAEYRDLQTTNETRRAFL